MPLALVAYPEMEATGLDLVQRVRAQENLLQFETIAPHFTIVFPVTTVDEADFGQHLASCLENCGSFAFVLRNVEMHRDLLHGHWHVFLVPDEGYREITGLHDRAYSGLLEPELRRDIPYIPHVGIGRGTDEARLRELTERLQKQSISIQGSIGKLDIIRLEDGKARTIQTIKLRQ